MILRQYQQEAERFLFDSITAGQRDLILESPVGSGKTSEVKALAAHLLERGHRLIVILVPQNLLKESWAAAGEWKLAQQTVRLGPGRIVERVRDLSPEFWRTGRGLVIVTRQALTRIASTLDKLGAKALADVLAVADEGHHCAAQNASGKALAALRSKGAATLLVSATPWSSSGDIGGPETVAHRLAPARYVCSFEPGDPSQPPREWDVEREFVGAPVDDAEETIDRSGSGPAAMRKAPAKRSEATRAREVCEAIAARWARDGFPRVVINVPRQFWREPILKALRAEWRKAGKAGAPDVLDLVGDMTDDELEAAQARLRADSAATRWADIKIDAVISCARMDEGTDWVPCSHVYNAGIPRSAGLILQRWGRASRPKGKIKGYPKRWIDRQTLVFFTPPVSEAGVEGAWQAHRETSWLLAGYLADFRAAKEWTQDRVKREAPSALDLPVPEASPTVRKLQGKLSAEVERRGGEMPEPEARAFLAKQGAAPADIDAAVRRMQMADERHRKAEEKREAALLAAGGLEVKSERRPDAEPLIEEFTTPVRVSRADAEVALRFTAMDAGQVAEKMRAGSAGYPWPETREGLIAFAQEHGRQYFEKHGKWPSKVSGALLIDGIATTWGALDSALYKKGSSLREVFGGYRHGTRSEANAQAIAAFCKEHGRVPVSGRRADEAENKLARALKSLRRARPDLCNKYDIPQSERGLASHVGQMRRSERERIEQCRRIHRAHQFGMLAEVIPGLCRAWRVTGASRVLVCGVVASNLNALLRHAKRRPSASRGLGLAPDIGDVDGVSRANDELAADCWRLWLDGADRPDPRPWADILAAGDNKRVVKAERVAFLDWTDLDKNGKPKRKPWRVASEGCGTGGMEAAAERRPRISQRVTLPRPKPRQARQAGRAQPQPEARGQGRRRARQPDAQPR